LEGPDLDKRFRNIDAEIGIMTIAGFKNKDQWQKIGIYVIKHKEKRERILRENHGEVETNLDA
jgi:hypothetical protein